MTKIIKHIGVGHHPFSKKLEFKGFFDDVSPCLIATDYKAPKCVLEVVYETNSDIEGDDNLMDDIRKEDEVTFEGKPFSYVSLFSGIGGFEQALNKLGGTCVFASEFDKFAQQSYTALYGDEHLHGDITKIDEKDVPDHDLLVGGFPCQSFSVAGKRKGFDDTRGTLFFDIVRIAAEKKPKALLLENVKGLVNHDKGNTLDVMIETLNEIGYVVDFDVLNSKYFGVPQNRERIFIVGIREDLVVAEAFSEESTKGQTIVPKGKRRIGEWADVFNFDFPEQGEVTTRLRDILETEVDEKYYLTDDKTAKLVAQLSDKDDLKQIGYVDKNMQGNRVYDVKGVGATIASQTGGLGGKGVTLFSEPQMLGHVDIKGHDAIKRVYDSEGISPTLTTMGGGHREPKNAEEVVSQKGFGETPEGLSYCLTTRYDNGFLPSMFERKERTAVIEEVRPVPTPDRIEKRQNGRRFKDDGEESFTLTSQDKHGVALGVKPRYRIRKLTPKECFRLQNFPDEAFDKLRDAGISDSQLYRQAGNAITVSVVEAIGKKLLEMEVFD